MSSLADQQRIDLQEITRHLKEQITFFLDKYTACYPGKPPTEEEVLSDIMNNFLEDHEH